MKKTPAILAALITTLLIGVSMFAIGANLWSSTQTSVQEAAAPTTDGTASADKLQIQQLQALVQEYQAREAQYQSQLNQAAQQVTQANQLANSASSQAQSYQQILTQLQTAGLIQIDAGGQITLNSSANNTNPRPGRGG
jgi:hypothetical protein